ncbi:MAG: hypothetical protein AAFN27_20070 [Pseudomonadota bacterium]
MTYSSIHTALRLDAEYAAHSRSEYLEAIARRVDVEPLDAVTSHISSGHTPYKHDVKTGEVGFVTVECVSPLRFHAEKLKSITKEQYTSEFSRQPIKKLSVLCTIKRRICQAFPFLEAPSEPLAINQDVALLEPNERIGAAYLATYLSSRVGQDFADRQKTEQMNPYISLVYLRTMPVVLLSTDFQNKIEDTIRLARRYEAEANRLKVNAEGALLGALGLASWTPPEPVAYQKPLSTIQSSKRMDAEHFDPRHLYAEEVIARRSYEHLRDLAEFVSSGPAWPSSSFTTPDDPDGTPFARIRNCKPGKIEVENLDRLLPAGIAKFKSGMARAGDIAIGMDGIRWFYAGTLDGDAYINQRVSWVRLNDDAPSPGYVQLVLNSPLGQAQLLRRMTIAQTVGHITLDDIRSIKIPVLNDAEMANISNAVEDSEKSNAQAALLLEAAKRAVEIAIEDGEPAALTFLDEVEGAD